MNYSQHALAAKDSLIRQISALAEKVEKPYKLYFGESDMTTPEFISRAAYEGLQQGHTFYTNTAGYLDLREAIAQKFEEVHGVKYGANEIVCTAGAVMAIHMAMRSCLDPGDNIVLITPTWPVFASIATLFGAETRPVALQESKEGFILDLDAVAKAVDSRTKMLIVNSPSNPTGWIISEAEQRALWELALRHDFTIMSDEVYDRLVFDGPSAPSFAKIATDKDHLIVINSFSKTYNMTGWRLGYALTNTKLAGLMTKLGEFIVSNPPALVQRAGIVALRDGEAYVKEIREKYTKQRQTAMDKLRAIPGVTLPTPRGGFYAFPKIEGLKDSLTFAKRLLQESRVGMAPGIAFGDAGEGHMRLCFAASDAVLVPALDILKEFVEKNQ